MYNNLQLPAHNEAARTFTGPSAMPTASKTAECSVSLREEVARMFSSVKLETQTPIERFDQPLSAPAGPLAHIPLFASLSVTEQQTMLASMREERIDANQNIVWHGDSGDSFYAINGGKVAICVAGENGNNLVL